MASDACIQTAELSLRAEIPPQPCFTNTWELSTSPRWHIVTAVVPPPPFLVWDRLALDLARFAQLKQKTAPSKKKKKDFKKMSETVWITVSLCLIKHIDIWRPDTPIWRGLFIVNLVGGEDSVLSNDCFRSTYNLLVMPNLYKALI